MKNTPSAPAPPSRHALADYFARLPDRLLAAILLGTLMFWQLFTDADYRVIFDAVIKGIGITVYVCVVAFFFAMLIGSALGLLRISSNRVLLEVASFYVEIVRGVPMLVILYYIAFVGGRDWWR